MKLNEHLVNVVRRARNFYDKNEPGHFLVSVDIPTETPALPPLCDFDLDCQLTEWLNCKLEAALWMGGKRRVGRRFFAGDISSFWICGAFSMAWA